MADKTKGASAGMTKREAVQRAIADLGKDAKPSQLQGHIRTKYGIAMTRGHVAVDRRKILQRESGKAAPKAPVQKAAGKTAPNQAAPRPQAKPAAAPPTNGHTIGLEDIATAKGLVDRVGADSLKKLIDVLAR